MGFTLPKISASLPKPSLPSLASMPAMLKPSLADVGKVTAIAAVGTGTIGVAAAAVANTGKDLGSKAVQEVKVVEKKAETTLGDVKDKVEDTAKQGTTLAISGAKKVGEIGSGMFNMVIFAGGAVVLAYMLIK